MSSLVVLETLVELRDAVSRRKRAGQGIGLVPTMGALHAGHLSLVAAACARCSSVLVSIFVNPAQFAPHEDFARYPRTLEADVALLDTVPRTDSEILVFAPRVETVYPSDFATEVAVVRGVSQPYEGAARPTHFAGVTTVVLKLFLMSSADLAFFGEKDFQQLAVIRAMARDLNVPIEIVGCPIVREADGLAMSSRNRYLNPPERVQSQSLARGLETGRRLIGAGTTDAAQIRDAVRQTLLEAETIEGGSAITIDYIAIVNPETLEEKSSIDGAVAILLAVRVGKTRLIDNTVVRR